MIRNVSDYRNTRQHIIVSSDDDILSMNAEFIELLLFTCLLNNVNISKDLLSAHNTMMAGLVDDPGSFRSGGVGIFRGNQVVHMAPQADRVSKLMKNLIDWLALTEEHPLITSCVFHYELEFVHPFSDGNGRTGRILNLLYLVNQGLLALPVLYLSKYIIENKNDYYYKLGTVSQRNDWKGWLIYMMKAVSYTSSYTNRLIDEILEQMETTLAYTKTKLPWYSKEVNELLFKQPYIKPIRLASVLNRTSRTTMTKYMKEITGLGIVSPKKDGKEVYYLNIDLIRILEDQ